MPMKFFAADDPLPTTVLPEMLIPRPVPDGVGHLGLELWTHAAMMAPQHLSTITDPVAHFQALHQEWMSEIEALEQRVGPTNLDLIDAGESEIRRRARWAPEELVHPIWDGTSDDLEQQYQLVPAPTLNALARYRDLRDQNKALPEIKALIGSEQFRVAVMLLESDGSAILEGRHELG